MLRATLTLLIFLLSPLTALAQLKTDAPTVLITGANRGLGLELARQYADRGWNVIATSRHTGNDPALAELRAVAAKHPQLAIERIDVTDTASIRAVAAKFHDQPIFVATKRDMKSMQQATPVDKAVAKLIKEIDNLSAERSGKITNFETGQIDPF